MIALYSLSSARLLTGAVAVLLAGVIGWQLIAGATPAALIAVEALALVAAGFAAVALHRVSGALKNIGAAAEQIAHSGDFSLRVPRCEGNPEAEKLRHAINHLVDVTDAFVREAGASMQHVAAGKYFRRIILRGLPGDFRASAERVNAAVADMASTTERFAELTDSFDKEISATIETVEQTVNAVSEQSKMLNGCAADSNHRATTMAAAATEASTNVQTVAGAAEQLSAAIQDITEQVERQATISQQARSNAETASGRMQELVETAEQIGEVLNLITEIAEKTNLLALNATIEAARAGEAGKGFAVVASEVKALSQQTASATEQIARQVQGIQDTTQRTFSANEQVTKMVENISEIAQAIAGAAEQQSAATREIAGSIGQASAGASEIAENITGVTAAASQTQSAAEEMAKAADDLARQVGVLDRSAVDYLKEARSICG